MRQRVGIVLLLFALRIYLSLLHSRPALYVVALRDLLLPPCPLRDARLPENARHSRPTTERHLPPQRTPGRCPLTLALKARAQSAAIVAYVEPYSRERCWLTYV
ncbi:MAG TPA: hypothetical protein VGF67_25220 [Ktedonobacteraceae bacterium]